MPDGGEPPRSSVRRLLWFAALWTAGVLVVTAVAYAIRLFIGL